MENLPPLLRYLVMQVRAGKIAKDPREKAVQVILEEIVATAISGATEELTAEHDNEPKEESTVLHSSKIGAAKFSPIMMTMGSQFGTQSSS